MRPRIRSLLIDVAVAAAAVVVVGALCSLVMGPAVAVPLTVVVGGGAVVLTWLRGLPAAGSNSTEEEEVSS